MSDNSLQRNDLDDIPPAEPVIRVLHTEDTADKTAAVTAAFPLKRLPENRYIDLRDALTYEHPGDALQVLLFCIEGMKPAFISNPNYAGFHSLADITRLSFSDLSERPALLLFGPRNAPVDSVLLTDDEHLIDRNQCKRLNFSDIFYHCACSMLGRDISYSMLEIALLPTTDAFTDDQPGVYFQIDPPQGAVVKLTAKGFEKNPKMSEVGMPTRTLRQLFPSYNAYLHAIGHPDGVVQSDIADMPKSRREKVESNREFPWSALAILFAVLTIISSIYVMISNFDALKSVLGN